MATYYVSPAGSDSNNGLGPDQSHGTNRPWLTIGKALATGSSVVPGDTVYVAPGVYRNSAAVVTIAGISSVGSPTALLGDPLNAQGFKNGSGVRLAPGLCWITVRAPADPDNEQPTANAHCLDLSTPTHGLIIRNLVLESGPADSALRARGDVEGLVVEDCRLIGGDALSWGAGTAPQANRNVYFRRNVCLVHNLFSAVVTTAPASADVDCQVVFEGNFVVGRIGAAIAVAPVGGNLAGGFRFRRNTFLTQGGVSNTFLGTTAGRVSTVAPFRLEGNLVFGGQVTLGTAGQVVDDGHNYWFSDDATGTNYTHAATSKEQPMAHLVLPDLVKWGLAFPSEDWFGWTGDAPSTVRVGAGSSTEKDWRGRTERPWGAGPSVGAFEYPDIAMDTGSQITGGGANSLRITGKGEVSRFVPVTAAATTITVKTKSASYGGTNYPQLIIEANPDIGVAQQTATATDATEQTLSIGPFTPTAGGVLELRFVSRSSAPASATYFDTLTG